MLVVGFQQRQAGDGPFSPSHAGASRARSLLSELLKDGALEQLHCDMAVDTEEEESEAEAYGLADSDFEAQLEAAEQFWATEDAYSEIPRTCTAPCSELSSVASEPIAIPATRCARAVHGGERVKLTHVVRAPGDLEPRAGGGPGWRASGVLARGAGRLRPCIAPLHHADTLFQAPAACMHAAAGVALTSDLPCPHTPSNPMHAPHAPRSYFKSDVQRAALNKLNEKRKWYAQQQENERMLCKSAIPESKALKQVRCRRRCEL